MDKVTLVFNVANYNTMMEGLASLPYKVSSPVIQEIMNQVNAQMPKMGSQLAAVPQEAKEG